MVYLTKDDQVMNFGRLRATYTHIITKFLNMICLNIAMVRFLVISYPAKSRSHFFI